MSNLMHHVTVQRLVRAVRCLAGVLPRIGVFEERLNKLMAMVDRLQFAVGRMEAQQHRDAGELPERHEFQVYSQWGEDGIINWLVENVIVSRPVFVEFGVEDYREANTRFLLQYRNWSGLVIDSDAANIETVRASELYWRYNLKAVSSFLTRENINQVLTENGVSGDIGLLSIDVDGNDYWIWDAISCVSPAIVVCEYSSLFGPSRPVTIPYYPRFDRRRAHPSWLYYGASLPALYQLGLRKGYILVGSNSVGTNAFFVRHDLAGRLIARSPEDVYVRAQHREARGSSGQLTFTDADQQLAVIAEMPVLDVVLGRVMPLRDAMGCASPEEGDLSLCRGASG